MNITETSIIGDIVSADYRTAAIFQSFDIDFCCNGNRSIAQACEGSNTQAGHLIRNLNEVLNKKEESSIDYQSWPVDLLIDYIEKKHHRYVEESSVVLKQYLSRICLVHGSMHPELFEVENLFNETAGELAMHMKKEELILFPYIKRMFKAKANNESIPSSNFETVQQPISLMMNEHTNEGERFRKIKSLTNNYTVPADGCNTYKVSLFLLKEFEEDLHLHIHLENNILFPKATNLEKNFD